jgi:hypothetical protein
MFKPALSLSLSHGMRYVWRGGIALSALALAVTACGSSGGGKHPTGSGTGSASAGQATGLTYRGTIYVSSQNDLGPKAWHLIKEFTEPLKGVRTCAAAAKGGGSDVFQVPSGKAPIPEDDILIDRFHGPGTYPPAMLKRDKLDTILVPGKTGLDQYDITTSAHGRKSGREVLFLNGNGSGELVYSNAHLDGKASSPAVAGLISWTCTS